jgi:hypothetical protein
MSEQGRMAPGNPREQRKCAQSKIAVMVIIIIIIIVSSSSSSSNIIIVTTVIMMMFIALVCKRADRAPTGP